MEKATEAVLQAQHELKEAEELKAQVVRSITDEDAGQGPAGGQVPATLPQLEGVLGPKNPEDRLCLEYVANKLAKAALRPKGTVVDGAQPDEPMLIGNDRRGAGGVEAKAAAALEAAGARVAARAGGAGPEARGKKGIEEVHVQE